MLTIFAHPDDETFSAAGVMAAAAERGLPVTVISATRGEAGESAIAGLDDPERLGVVRERELREAMRQIGVLDVRLLGHRDSGMADPLQPSIRKRSFAYRSRPPRLVSWRISGRSART